MTTAISSAPSQIVNSSTGVAGATDKNVADTQDRFLKLLITQMKSQDPMNPMDNAAVTSQIAQISTVSGIDKLNATMESLSSSLLSNQLSQGAALMGKSVVTPGNMVEFKSGQGFGGVQLAGPADTVSVTIADRTTGAPLRIISMGGQSAGLQTSQLTTDLPDGTYQISVKASLAGKSVDVTPVTTGQINSVKPGSTGGPNLLGLSNGLTINQSSILELM